MENVCIFAFLCSHPHTQNTDLTYRPIISHIDLFSQCNIDQEIFVQRNLGILIFVHLIFATWQSSENF